MPCERPSSKKQLRWAFAAEERGELPEGTAERWAEKYKRKKKSSPNKILEGKIANYLKRINKKHLS
jgi:hypothetical protein